MWQALRDRLRVQSPIDVFNDVVLKPIRDFFAQAPLLTTLTCVATIASAVSGWYSYKASATAARVAEAGQAFTEKTYQDQIAMGRPSIAAMSGETFVSSIEPARSVIDPPEAKYSLRIMLRNSGVRTTEHAWVVAAPGGADMATDALQVQVVALPKDVDVPVQFDLWDKPATDSQTEWYVGVAYEDVTPVPAGPPSPMCSDITVVKMESWPQDPTKDPSTRMLSAGSPVAVPPPPTDPNGQPSPFREPPTVVHDVLAEAMGQETACQGKKF